MVYLPNYKLFVSTFASLVHMTEEQNWKELQELRVIGEGQSATTIPVKSIKYSVGEQDGFNIDYHLAATDSLNKSQVEVSNSSLFQEYAVVDKIQKSIQDEGSSLADLRKAIGELSLLQALTSALRENATYTLKDTYGQEYDSKRLELPILQEIKVMQDLNTHAYQTLSTNIQKMRANLTKRRQFEQDLLECRKHWSILKLDRRTRQLAERPENIAYQQDRDLLVIDSYWRPRPRLYQNPYYFTFLRMQEESGMLELDKTFNQLMIRPASAMTLQVSIHRLQRNMADNSYEKVIASVDLWTLLNQNLSEYQLSLLPKHLQSVYQYALALQHTSLARDLFGKLADEVSMATTIVTTINSSNASGSSTTASSTNPYDEFPSPSFHQSVLTEQFTLCEHTDRSLSWQISEHLVFTVRLVPFDFLQRISSSSTSANRTDSGARHVDAMDEDEQPVAVPDYDVHWQQLVQYTYLTLFATFHTTIVTAERDNEIDRQWRQRSGETERQIIVRRATNAATLKNAANTDTNLENTGRQVDNRVTQSASMVADVFRVLRIQHQCLRLQSILTRELAPILVQSGIAVTNTNTNESYLQLVPTTLPPLQNSSSVDSSHHSNTLLAWWQAHIAVLLSYHYRVRIPCIVMNIPTSAKQQIPTVLTLTLSSPVETSSIAKDLVCMAEDESSFPVPVNISHNASVHTPQPADVVKIRDITAVVLQQVLSYILRWKKRQQWDAIMSTQFAIYLKPSLQRTAVALHSDSCHGKGGNAEKSEDSTLGTISMSLWELQTTSAVANKPKYVTTLNISANTTATTTTTNKDSNKDATAANIASTLFPHLATTITTANGAAIIGAPSAVSLSEYTLLAGDSLSANNGANNGSRLIISWPQA